MHFEGSYGRRFHNTYFGDAASVRITLNLFSVDRFSGFIENLTTHNSPPPIYFLFPQYIDYETGGGLKFGDTNSPAVIPAIYSFNQRHFGDFDNRYPVKYHRLAVRVESPGMNIDHTYSSVKGMSAANTFANSIQWRIIGEKYINQMNLHHRWGLGGTLEWRVVAGFGFIPYFSPSATVLRNSKNDINWSVETGFYRCSEILFRLFLRFEDTVLDINNHRTRERSIYSGFTFER